MELKPYTCPQQSSSVEPAGGWKRHPICPGSVHKPPCRLPSLRAPREARSRRETCRSSGLASPPFSFFTLPIQFTFIVRVSCRSSTVGTTIYLQVQLLVLHSSTQETVHHAKQALAADAHLASTAKWWRQTFSTTTAVPYAKISEAPAATELEVILTPTIAFAPRSAACAFMRSVASARASLSKSV